MLTTLAKLKTHLEIPALDLTLDTKITAHGEAASKAINRYCNQILEQQTVTEYLHGSGKVDVILASKPTSITSVTEDGVTLSNYTYNEYYLYKEDKIRWNVGYDNIVVNYTSGYTTATVPPDLELAVWLLTEHYFRINQDRRLDRSNVSKNGESVTFNIGIPEDVKVLLEPYRKIVF